MSKKIIVAGGGHGGIATASFLAEKGFDVTVFERNGREHMGYDWTDIFDPGALAAAGLDMPPEDKFEYKVNMTFYGPNEKTPIRQRVPESELEIKMERRDIYDMLITRAENAGVKFEFEHAITAPIMCGDRVVGIKTDKGEHFADLVIDACGVESPVRANLPDCCNIQKHPVEFEKFYVYRAFYNKASDEKVEDKYKVYLLPEGKLGIGWVAAEENYTDLLIGRFEPFDMAEAERTAEYFRSKNPILGTEVLRGGQFTEISVRQPLSVLVADGYAAIGDSAFMTVPIIGSGIANALKMSRVLADVIIADNTETYSAETLWKYQLDFYKIMGSGLAPLAAVKLLLTRITPDQLDYILDNGILTWKELTITANSTNLSSMLSFSSDMPQRALMIVKNKELLKQLLRVAGDIAKIVAVTAAMPKHYARHTVKKWARKYDEIFR